MIFEQTNTPSDSRLKAEIRPMVGTRADWKKYRWSGAAFRMVVDVTQRLELAGMTFLGTRCTAQPSLGSAVLLGNSWRG